jgi:hypothetical protein
MELGEHEVANQITKEALFTYVAPRRGAFEALYGAPISGALVYVPADPVQAIIIFSSWNFSYLVVRPPGRLSRHGWV